MNSPKSPAEHRQYLRLSTVFPVEFRMSEPGREDGFSLEFHQAFTRDIGLGGMGLTFKDPTGRFRDLIRPGAHLMLFLNLPIRKHPFEAVAEVAWVKVLEKHHPEHTEFFLGVKYLVIAPENQQIIMGYARKLHRRPYWIAAYVAMSLLLLAGAAAGLLRNRYMIYALMDRVRTVSLELRDMERQKQETERKLSQIQNERQSGQDQLRRLEKQILLYQVQIEGLENEPAQSRAMGYAAEQKREELIQQVRRSEAGRKSTEQKISSLQSELQVLQDKLAYQRRYRPVPESVTARERKAAGADTRQLDGMIDDLQDQIRSLQEELSRYEVQDRDKLRQPSGKQSWRWSSRVLLATDLQGGAGEPAALPPQDGDKTAQVEIQGIQDGKARLEALVTQLRGEVEALRAERDRYKEEAGQRQSETQGLVIMGENLRKTIRDLQEQVTDYKTRLENRDSGNGPLVATMREEIAALQGRLDEYKRQASSGVSAPAPVPAAAAPAAPAAVPAPAQEAVVQALKEEVQALQEKIAAYKQGPSFVPPPSSAAPGPRQEVLSEDRIKNLEDKGAISDSKLNEYLFPAKAVINADTAQEGCFLGAFVGTSQVDRDAIQRMERAVGKKLAQVVIFRDFKGSFPERECREIAAGGAVPHIVWEPHWWTNASKVTLADIAAGKWDDYIAQWGADLARFGGPVFVRWGHEFNGNWYAWTLVRNGKSPELYVQAYRRVHDVLRRSGATNALMVWCMNDRSVPNEPWNNPQACYPGDAYVDWIGVDGYNWGKGQNWSMWVSFEAIFKGRYELICRLWKKPIMICEVSSAEYGGQKGLWIEGMAVYLKNEFPAVRALCWFNENKERNWLLWSSEGALLSAQRTLRDDYFLSSGPKLAGIRGAPEK